MTPKPEDADRISQRFNYLSVEVFDKYVTINGTKFDHCLIEMAMPMDLFHGGDDHVRNEILCVIYDVSLKVLPLMMKAMLYHDQT